MLDCKDTPNRKCGTASAMKCGDGMVEGKDYGRPAVTVQDGCRH